MGQENSPVFLEKWSSGKPHQGRVFAAVFAHSDDLAIFAGGLTMKLISEGYTGYFIKTTNDEMDSYELSMAETVYRLYNETLEVTTFLGLKKLYSLDYKNHYLEHGQLSEIRHRLITLFRFLKVDTVASKRSTKLKVELFGTVTSTRTTDSGKARFTPSTIG